MTSQIDNGNDDDLAVIACRNPLDSMEDDSTSILPPARFANDSPVECIICAAEFDSTHRVCITPCGHYFGHACLLRWMKTKSNCPQCKRKLTSTQLRVPKVNVSAVSSSAVAEDVFGLQVHYDEVQHTLQEAKEAAVIARRTAFGQRRRCAESLVRVRRRACAVATSTGHVDPTIASQIAVWMNPHRDFCAARHTTCPASIVQNHSHKDRTQRPLRSRLSSCATGGGITCISVSHGWFAAGCCGGVVFGDPGVAVCPHFVSTAAAVTATAVAPALGRHAVLAYTADGSLVVADPRLPNASGPSSGAGGLALDDAALLFAAPGLLGRATSSSDAASALQTPFFVASSSGQLRLVDCRVLDRPLSKAMMCPDSQGVPYTPLGAAVVQGPWPAAPSASSSAADAAAFLVPCNGLSGSNEIFVGCGGGVVAWDGARPSTLRVTGCKGITSVVCRGAAVTPFNRLAILQFEGTPSPPCKRSCVMHQFNRSTAGSSTTRLCFYKSTVNLPSLFSATSNACSICQISSTPPILLSPPNVFQKTDAGKIVTNSLGAVAFGFDGGLALCQVRTTDPSSVPLFATAPPRSMTATSPGEPDTPDSSAVSSAPVYADLPPMACSAAPDQIVDTGGQVVAMDRYQADTYGLFGHVPAEMRLLAGMHAELFACATSSRVDMLVAPVFC